MNSDEIKLSITDAIAKLKCSNATVYNRIRKFGWRHEKDDDGNAFVFIPSTYLQRFEDIPEPESTYTPAEPQKVNNDALERVVQLLEKSYEERLNDKRELLDTKEKLIESQKQTIEALNNQLGAVQNQLIKYRDKSKEKPWWKFWD